MRPGCEGLHSSQRNGLDIMNVAIIGTGYIGKVHLQVLKAMPGIRRILLVDPDRQQAAALASLFDLEEPREDYRSLLDDPYIDAIHNCTPNHLHYGINRDFLRAGKHILSEKPLCLEESQAEELCTLAEAGNLVTGVNFCYRYYPAVQEAAARIARGDIGDIFTAGGFFLQDWLFRDTDYSWRLDERYSGISNALGDIGSHWCDLVQFLTGRKIVRVFADLRTIHPVRKKARGGSGTFSRTGEMTGEEVPVRLEDYGAVLFRLDNGAAGSFTVCQACAGQKVNLDIQIYGSRASLRWSHLRPESLVMGNRDSETLTFTENSLQQVPETASFARLPSGHPMGYHDAVHNLFSEFYHQMSTGSPLHRGCPDFREGLREMKIVRAAVESFHEQRWKEVEEN